MLGIVGIWSEGPRRKVWSWGLWGVKFRGLGLEV